MNDPSLPPRRTWSPGYAQLAAVIGIIIPQALTMQRSLKSPGISDYVGLVVCWVLIPVIITLGWLKWRESRFTIHGDMFCLAIGAILQSTMLVTWPATTMPSTLFFWVGTDLVSFSGAWMQAGIIGIAMCLGTHALVFHDARGESSGSIAAGYHSLAIGTGIAIGGAGLYLATYTGWTMYLVPSIITWLVVGFLRLFRTSWKDVQAGFRPQAALHEVNPPGWRIADISKRLAGWASAILAILPVLLLSMNFQRHRYAAGYWFPLLLVGGVCVLVTLIHSVILSCMRRFHGNKRNHVQCSGSGFVKKNIGLLIALGVDILIVYQLATGLPADNTTFFKSNLYLGAVCVSVVSCLPALSSWLVRLSDRAAYHDRPSKAFGRIFFSAILLAIMLVVFLLEGTSMIFSWQFGDEVTWIVGASTIAVAGLFLGISIGLDLHPSFNRKAGEGKSCDPE